jgi:hypothetical protein
MAKAKAVKAGKAEATVPATATPPAVIAGTGSPGPIPGLAAAGAAVTDLADFLAADTTAPAVAAATPKKSSIPSVPIPELAEATREFIEGQRLMKDGEARMSNAATKIKPVAERVRVEYSRTANELQKSINVNGQVTYTVGRYRQLKETPARPLAAIMAQADAVFGAGGFKRWFDTEPSYSMKAAALTPDKARDSISFLKSVLGARFDEFFEREVVVVPNDAFHSARTLSPEVARQYEAARNTIVAGQALVTPNEPSVK